MYRVAICEDEELEIKRIIRHVEEYGEEQNIELCVDVYESGEKFLEANYKEYDILILDIIMKQINGVDLAKIIRGKNEECRIIFLTGLEKYWPEGFKLNATRYILKPFDKDEFNEALTVSINELKKYKRFITVSYEGKIINISLEYIYYLEICDRKVKVCSKNGTYYSKTLMKTWGEFLVPYGFAYTHKSYLVNMRYVKELHKEKVTLLSGDEIYISKRKYKEFRDAFTKYIGEIL